MDFKVLRLFMDMLHEIWGCGTFGGTSEQSMKVFSARPICESIPLYAILKIGGFLFIKPDKQDLLFHIATLLDLRVGGR